MNVTTGDRFVVPGMRLCSVDEHVGGNGTYTLQGFVYASVCGCIRLIEEGGKVEVAGGHERALPAAIGDLVTAKVASVTPRAAKLHILCVGSSALKEPFRAQLRKEDIRATEKDKVEMYKSFRAGDIVLARVISLGEPASGYLVSTAENELGVAVARSEESGLKMIPVNWQEMQCPKTYVKEFRKIAKICPENLVIE